MSEFALTTVDNPFSPFTQWNAWLQFDELHGYNTCELLGRFAKTSVALSDADNDKQISEAMTRIVELHPSLYKVVTANDGATADASLE